MLNFPRVALVVLLYGLLFECNPISTKTWSEASEDKCKFTINHEDDVHFIENPSLFINKFQARDVHECRKVCCNHESCNGYVWDGNDSLEDCKLLKCSNEGTDCKQALKKVPANVDKRMHEVGFITGVTSAEPSSIPVSPGIPKTTTTPKARLAPETPTTTSPMEMVKKLAEMLAKAATKPTQQANNSANQKVSNDVGEINDYGNIQNTTQKPTDGTLNTTTVLPTKPTLNTTFSTTKSSNISRRTSTTVINPTRRPIQRVTGVIDTNTSSNHTDSVSLSAALLFGVIFLLVVFYLVGKRWIEGLRDSHRRGYTRISYLLNGI